MVCCTVIVVTTNGNLTIKHDKNNEAPTHEEQAWMEKEKLNAIKNIMVLKSIFKFWI